MIDDFLDGSLAHDLTTQFSSALGSLHKHINSVAQESRPQTVQKAHLPSLIELFGESLPGMDTNPCVYFMAQIYELIRIKTSVSSEKPKEVIAEIINVHKSLAALNLSSAEQAHYFLQRPKALSYLIYAVIITQNNKPIEDILNHAQGIPQYEQLRWFAGYCLGINVPFEDTVYHQQFMIPFTEAVQIPLVEPKQPYPVALIHPIDALFSILKIDQITGQMFPEPVTLRPMPPNEQLLRALFQLQGAISLLIVCTLNDHWHVVNKRFNAAMLSHYQKFINVDERPVALAVEYSDYTEHLAEDALKHSLAHPGNEKSIETIANYLVAYEPKSLHAALSLHKSMKPLLQLFLVHGFYFKAYDLVNEIDKLYEFCSKTMSPAKLSKIYDDILHLKAINQTPLHIKELKWFSLYLHLLDNLLRQKLTIDQVLGHPDFQEVYVPYRDLKHKTEGSIIADLVFTNLEKLASRKIKKSSPTFSQIGRFYEYMKPGLTTKQIKQLDASFSVVDKLILDFDKTKPVKKKAKTSSKAHANSGTAKKIETANNTDSSPATPSAENAIQIISTPSPAQRSIETENIQLEEITSPKKKAKRKKKPQANSLRSKRVKKAALAKKQAAIATAAPLSHSPRFFPSAEKHKSHNPTEKKVLEELVILPDELLEFFRPFFNDSTLFYLAGAAPFELRRQKIPYDYDVLAIGLSHKDLFDKAEKMRLKPQIQGITHPIVKMSLPSGKEVEVTCIAKNSVDAEQILLEDFKTRDLKNAAMYLPILEDKQQLIISFEQSLQTSDEGILQTVSPPSQCWSEDALRLLRLVKWKLKFPELQFSAEIQQALNNPDVSILELFKNQRVADSLFRKRLRTALDGLFKRFSLQAVTNCLLECGILHSLLDCSKVEIKLNQEIIEFNLVEYDIENPMVKWLNALQRGLRDLDQDFYRSPLISLVYLNTSELDQLRELAMDQGISLNP